MKRLVELYVDDVVDNNTLVTLLNMGKNRMAQEVKCRFPDITLTTNLDDTFVFSEEYHEIPVFYAAAMIKAQDSSIREKESFLAQFELGLQNFVENYDPPVQYLDLPNVEHFTATAGQLQYTITKNDYHPTYGNLKVYRNSIRVFDIEKDGNSFSLPITETVSDGDIITAIWEINADYIYRPAFYPGW